MRRPLILFGFLLFVAPFPLTYLFCIGEGNGCGDLIIIFLPGAGIGLLMMAFGAFLGVGTLQTPRRASTGNNLSNEINPPIKVPFLKRIFVPTIVIDFLIYPYLFFPFEERGFYYLRYLPVLLLLSVAGQYYSQKIPKSLAIISELTPVSILVLYVVFIAHPWTF